MREICLQIGDRRGVEVILSQRHRSVVAGFARIRRVELVGSPNSGESGYGWCWLANARSTIGKKLKTAAVAADPPWFPVRKNWFSAQFRLPFLAPDR